MNFSASYHPCKLNMCNTLASPTVPHHHSTSSGAWINQQLCTNFLLWFDIYDTLDEVDAALLLL